MVGVVKAPKDSIVTGFWCTTKWKKSILSQKKEANYKFTTVGPKTM